MTLLVSLIVNDYNIYGRLALLAATQSFVYFLLLRYSGLGV